MTNEELILKAREIIEKATITSPNLSGGGKLNPKQANQFIDYVIDESIMQQAGVRVEKFNNEEMLLEKLGVGTRVAVPKAEAADPAIRRGITTDKITLKPVDIMVPFEIGDLIKRINIEGKNLEDKLIRLMARQLNNNLEELWWDGNTVGPAVLENEIVPGGSDTLYVKDTYLALFNGWLKSAASGHVVDAQNADISQSIFGKAFRAMPRKYKRNKGNLRWWVSSNHEQHYREGLSGRATPLGDAAVNAEDSPKPMGIRMVPVNLLSEEPQYAEDSVANTDGTTATALTYKPITSLVLTEQALAKIPKAKYILDTDYSQDLAAGTWTRLGAGAIGSGATVKATYNAAGKMILAAPTNFVLAFSLDGIRIERDRNIFKTVNEFAITVSVYCTFEETDAVVLVTNMAVPS